MPSLFFRSLIVRTWSSIFIFFFFSFPSSTYSPTHLSVSFFFIYFFSNLFFFPSLYYFIYYYIPSTRPSKEHTQHKKKKKTKQTHKFCGVELWILSLYIFESVKGLYTQGKLKGSTLPITLYHNFLFFTGISNRWTKTKDDKDNGKFIEIDYYSVRERR